ncbi:unnamed protein product [Lathyrus oleraceus]
MSLPLLRLCCRCFVYVAAVASLMSPPQLYFFLCHSVVTLLLSSLQTSIPENDRKHLYLYKKWWNLGSLMYFCTEAWRIKFDAFV